MNKKESKKPEKEENYSRYACRTPGGLLVFCKDNEARLKHNCAGCVLKSDIWR